MSDSRLVPPLVLLTCVTGLVDAVSYLRLGHVFVANMTGNVVFLGFALGGAAEVSAQASIVAIAAFVAGSVAGGRHGTRLAHDRERLLAHTLVVELVLVVAAALVASAGDVRHDAVRDAVIVLLAVGLGAQNATARRLAVPELTTTVLTMTVTGIAADSRLAGGTGARTGRRLLALGAMLAGAAAGALILQHAGPGGPLVLAAGILAIATIVLSARQGKAAVARTTPRPG